MRKKIAVWIAIVLVLFIGAIIIRVTYEPEYHEGVLTNTVIYTFNPQTINASLDRGDIDVFSVAPPEPEDGWPRLWPPGSFAWNQKDYMKIANALHQFVWKESLEDWQLVYAGFQVRQCHDVLGKFDIAALSFYKRNGVRNIVHGMWIDPLHGIVTIGDDSGYVGIWKGIDLKNIPVNSADTALQMAEENGGREARLLAKNECYIYILFAPYVLKHSFLSHPFYRYDWGWSIRYVNDALTAIFNMTIDPYTGKYKIPKAGR